VDFSCGQVSNCRFVCFPKYLDLKLSRYITEELMSSCTDWLTAKLWSELSFNMCPAFIHMKHNLWTSRSSTWGSDLNCKILNNVPYTRVLHSLTSQFIFQLGDYLNAWYSALSLVLMEAQNKHMWPNPQLQKL